MYLIGLTYKVHEGIGPHSEAYSIKGPISTPMLSLWENRLVLKNPSNIRHIESAILNFRNLSPDLNLTTPKTPLYELRGTGSEGKAF